ncbi:hypothetical protein ABIA85_005938 [Bradyrhizobium sp. LA6.10]
MSSVGRPGGFANVGMGRYATRPRSGRWVIANHLLVKKAQTRAQMLHQWDQRTCADAWQIGGVRARSYRLDKIRRRDPNRPRPAVRQRDNDVGRTAPRPLLQHLKPVPEQKMMRVSDRDVRHDPLENRGTLTCSVTRPSPTPSWIGSSTMLTASHSRETACERSLRSAPILTQPKKPDPTPHAGNDTPAAFVGTGGRLRSECMVAFNRNPWPQSPESAAISAKVLVSSFQTTTGVRPFSCRI